MAKICCRPGCDERAIVHLSYFYDQLRVEVCSLAGVADPGFYVLCRTHLDRLKLPKGWTLITQALSSPAATEPDELLALAAQIRRAGGLAVTTVQAGAGGVEYSLSRRTNLVMLTSRAHLRVVADAATYDVAATG